MQLLFVEEYFNIVVFGILKNLNTSSTKKGVFVCFFLFPEVALSLGSDTWNLEVLSGFGGDL